VKARKGEVPFEGMSMAQKKHPGDILCHNIEDYDKFLILIEDYKIDKSRVDFKMEQVEEVDDQGFQLVGQRDNGADAAASAPLSRCPFR
jgi:hypothetical protein